MSINRLIERDSSSRPDAILAAATRLFAERGYDGVGTRDIAAAVGLNLATVHYHVGTKGELYGQVVRRLFADEEALFTPFLERLAAADALEPETFARLAGEALAAMVDLLVARPERARLYVRRWVEGGAPLERPSGGRVGTRGLRRVGAKRPKAPGRAGEEASLRALEADLSLATHRRLRAALQAAQARGLVRSDLDLDFFLRTLTWAMLGYACTGPVDRERWRGDPRQPRARARFAAYLADLVARLTRP